MEQTVKFYVIKIPGLEKYLITKEGSIFNTYTKTWIEGNDLTPGIVKLEINGVLRPFRVIDLIENIDKEKSYDWKNKTTKDVNFYVTRSLITKETQVFDNEKELIDTYEGLDIQVVNRYLKEGYLYNFRDEVLISNGELESNNKVNFDIFGKEIIHIVDKHDKTVREITGDNLLKYFKVFKDIETCKQESLAQGEKCFTPHCNKGAYPEDSLHKHCKEFPKTEVDDKSECYPISLEAILANINKLDIDKRETIQNMLLDVSRIVVGDCVTVPNNNQAVLIEDGDGRKIN